MLPLPYLRGLPIRIMRVVYFFLLLVLFSCDPDNSSTDAQETTTEPDRLKTQLLGTWETMELNVHSPSYEGQDTVVNQIIKESEWGKVYGVKPAQTVYTADRKLRRSHFYANGQLINVVNGIWKLEGDSLHIIEPNITFSYLAVFDNQKMTLTGLIDWDRDGERDDSYEATFRLVSQTD